MAGNTYYSSEQCLYILTKHCDSDDPDCIPGSIWIIENQGYSQNTVVASPYIKSKQNIQKEIKLEHLRRIEPTEADLLSGIQDCRNRLKVMDDPDWIKEGMEICIGNTVFIYGMKDIPEGDCGIVRYVGPVEGLNGKNFGIELSSENHGKGLMDGVYRRTQYFTCEQDNGLMLSIEKIRKRSTPDNERADSENVQNLSVDQGNSSNDSVQAESSLTQAKYLLYDNVQPSEDIQDFNAENILAIDQENSSSIFQDEQKTLFGIDSSKAYHSDMISKTEEIVKPKILKSEEIVKPKTPKHEMPFFINERAVWMSDSGAEFCTVKWIGKLPGSKDSGIIVGVEFDNPVGTGTGKYKGQQLFVAKRMHASLIPMLGLMRASTYMDMMNGSN